MTVELDYFKRKRMLMLKSLVSVIKKCIQIVIRLQLATPRVYINSIFKHLPFNKLLIAVLLINFDHYCTIVIHF